MLRKMFGPTQDELTGGMRKLHNDGLHGLYPLSNIIQVITSRRMRWVGNVVHMGGEQKCTQGFDGAPRQKETAWKT
jgi:hypothetical protein